MHVIITAPVYQDWESAALLCQSLDENIKPVHDLSWELLLIDDGSIQSVNCCFSNIRLQRLQSVSILTLRRNLGHQRAIAIGLSYIQQKLICDAVIVMDADGEDRPQDISLLFDEFRRRDQTLAVFAERGRRVETFQFKVFYVFYRVLHRFLTGRGIRIGNFSILPRHHVDALVAFPELWNHYAAAVFKSRLPFTTVRADRGRRLRGKSQMNFVNLVVHGLSALFAYQEIVGTRILIASCGLSGVLGIGILILFVLKLFTALPIPWWITLSIGLLGVLIAQLLTTSLAVIFSVMMNRSTLGFLPLRDYTYFVLRHEVVT